MSAVRNVAREKLEQGQLALGVGIRMTRSVEIAKAMAVAGFDWLFLDNGALGIVVPHVDTGAEAREVVDRLKYPPVGHRSMGGIGPHYWLRSVSTGEAAQALNGANLTIVMLETPTAIENAAEIAAVPGIDVLLIGSNDLCAEMGIPGDFGSERVAQAYRTTIAACQKHGKFPGHAALCRDGRSLHPVRPGRPVPDGRRGAAHRLHAEALDGRLILT
jgi:4-hydroxy-2-oxoheptanedioate aldolase